MDFEFSEEQKAFAKEVEAFLDANDDPDVFDVTRENMAQIVDTPKRRAFMKKLGHKGWLGMTWPKEYGGSEGEGVYEYILNEALAGRGGPQIGKGVGIIGKTLIRHGTEKLKQEFLPKILENDVEFAVGYSEPDAGSDAANMQLKAVKHTAEDGRRLAAERPEDLDHLGPLRRLVLGRRPHRPRQQAHGHHPVPGPAGPPGHHDPRHLDHRRRAHQRGLLRRRLRARRLRGRRGEARASSYISEALDLERFTMFTFSPIKQRLELLIEYVQDRPSATASRCKDDPIVRAADRPARTPTPRWPGCWASSSWPRRSRSSTGRGGKATSRRPSRPRSTSSSPPSSRKRLANAAMDIGGPGQPAAGAHRGRPDEGPLRVDLPLHGDRHDRRRRLRDPEEHHRPPRPRPPQELLSADWRSARRRRSTASRVLDFATVGPGRPRVAHARRLRRRRGQGRRRRPRTAACRSSRRSTPTAGTAACSGRCST